ncbi:hypothetical protein [Variovorax guangxiensis]|uniref:Peptidase C39-like domain-containing protein n=1 Tax=Variovorax guangxiensis TaxID=1775474 RepID=A0A840FSV4_9BURK|nr:hypothetical protein [Variovorax guangxiensis]MBB4223922.1 hypothetical protein [Variovorax guangxiensis]
MATKTKTAAAAKTVAPNAAVDSDSTVTGLPAGFVSPFKRVEMQPNIRVDDGLCCLAMLTNQPLDTIMQAAFRHGLAPHGPAWCYASHLQSILREYGLNAEEKECPTIDALPDVALITAEYNPATQYGRWVLWHHVRAAAKVKSFHYVIDPAYWIDPSRHIVTTDIQRLITPKSPIYYLGITPKTMTKGKSK